MPVSPTLTAPPEKRTEIAALAQIVNGLRPGELQMVEIPANLDSRKPVIEWAVPELANFGLRAEADSSIPGSILVSPVHPWPSPMLPPKRAMADAQPASFTVEGNSIRVLVPFETLQPGRMTLALELSDGRFFRQVVPMRADENVNHPPVLLNLELPEGGIQTFEAQEVTVNKQIPPPAGFSRRPEFAMCKTHRTAGENPCPPLYMRRA